MSERIQSPAQVSEALGDHHDLSKLRDDALAAAEFFRRAPALAVSADAVIDLYCAIARTADVIEAIAARAALAGAK